MQSRFNIVMIVYNGDVFTICQGQKALYVAPKAEAIMKTHSVMGRRH
jgi:hypothetical protein